LENTITKKQNQPFDFFDYNPKKCSGLILSVASFLDLKKGGSGAVEVSTIDLPFVIFGLTGL